MLIENVVHADTEHKHHQRPEARHTQQRQRILQPQIFRFAERQARHGVRLHLAEQQQEYQGGGGGQPEIDVRIDIEDKTGQKVALAQPSDPHAGAAEFETADAADSLGIRFQRADAGEEGGADKYPPTSAPSGRLLASSGA